MGLNVSTHLCIRRPGREIEYLCDGPWIPRDYLLYSLMGMGGTGEPQPLFEPRGVPTDASRRLLWEMRDSPQAVDEMFHSWLTTDELRQVAERYESEPAFQEAHPDEEVKVGPHFAATIGAMGALDRVVS